MSDKQEKLGGVVRVAICQNGYMFTVVQDGKFMPIYVSHDRYEKLFADAYKRKEIKDKVSK